MHEVDHQERHPAEEDHGGLLSNLDRLSHACLSLPNLLHVEDGLDRVREERLGGLAAGLPAVPRLGRRRRRSLLIVALLLVHLPTSGEGLVEGVHKRDEQARQRQPHRRDKMREDPDHDSEGQARVEQHHHIVGYFGSLGLGRVTVTDKHDNVDNGSREYHRLRKRNSLRCLQADEQHGQRHVDTASPEAGRRAQRGRDHDQDGTHHIVVRPMLDEIARNAHLRREKVDLLDARELIRAVLIRRAVRANTLLAYQRFSARTVFVRVALQPDKRLHTF
jgi:hypothetical protein